MPLKVGELYATLKLDDSDFNRRLGTAGGQFTKFKSALATGCRPLRQRSLRQRPRLVRWVLPLSKSELITTGCSSHLVLL